MRYVIRSSCNIPTARRLKDALGARRVVDKNFFLIRQSSPDYHRDLFLSVPEPHTVLNTPEGYHHLGSFFRISKGAQRIVLEASGLPIIPTRCLAGVGAALPGARFVVRPDHHRAGQGFRITTDQDGFGPREYISTLIPKDKEYRVVFYKGQHVCTYLKSNPNNLAADQPWTHSNGCVFMTINNPRNDYVTRSGLTEKLLATKLTKTAHLIAYDILRAGNDLYVCEANLAPGISIASTIQKIVDIESSLGARNDS